ncbi:MAG: molybdopterin-dependent oxidoreductase [Acidobacteria bacterium]|nr:molybdopterin-dependent oxidoreductase [Acidobacteriota bacterium]
MAQQSHCPLDCPDLCSLDVEVEDGRVVSVDGNEQNALTDGYICSKVRGLPEHLYGDERLLYPMVRSGAKGSGQFERASWDDALDLIAEQMRGARDHYGGESILPLSYGGSNGLLTQDTTDARLWRRVGASNLARNVCAVPTTTAATEMYGKMPGVAFQDYPEAELIIVWGGNPGATGIHVLPHIREAQRRGAKLVVIDPRSHKLARSADLHLPIRPATDVALALALGNWVFEAGHADQDFLAEHAVQVEAYRERASGWTLERAADLAGLELEQVQQVAEWYAAASPAVIRCGWGLERNRNGCGAAAAVMALPAIAGKFGVRGGGYTMSNSGAAGLSAGDAANEPETDARTINMNRLGRELLEQEDPPVKVLFVYNCNAVATMPDQERVLAGLARDDLFTVVYEQVNNDTVPWADVVLPATAMLEHSELSNGYGAMVVQHHGPVAVPVGEARPNYDVFQDLCVRLDLTKPDDPVGADALAAAILGTNGYAETLAADGIAPAVCGERPVQMVDTHPRTADQKVHLLPASLEQETGGNFYAYRDDPATSDHPLALISPASGKMITSTFGQTIRRQWAMHMHPADAEARGVADGDKVRMYNDLGEVHVLVKVTDRVRSGVVFLPKGLWSHHTLNGRTTNALCSDAPTDCGEGATFNDARVQVELLAD